MLYLPQLSYLSAFGFGAYLARALILLAQPLKDSLSADSAIRRVTEL